MEDFLIEISVSKNINLSNIVEVIGHSMGLEITLNEGYKKEDYSDDEIKLMYLSEKFDINKPIEKGNFACYSSILQGEVENNIKIYRKNDRSNVLVLIEDKVGQKNIFKEIQPLFGSVKKIQVKTTDAYSFFLMKRVIDVFGGELRVLNEKVNTVFEDKAMFHVGKDYYSLINFTKSKNGFDINDEETYLSDDLKVKANIAIETISNAYNNLDVKYTKLMLQMKAPTIKETDNYEKILKKLDIKRMRKIAENELNNNHVLVCNWIKMMDDLTSSTSVHNELTKEDKRKQAQERNSKVKRRVR